MCAAFALLVDGVLCLPFGFFKKKWILNFASFAALGAFVWFLWDQERIKTPPEITTLETNEAVTCLTNIIRENPDFKWTIVSANDETQMGIDHGYHYETITFLREMEYAGKYAMITIPTDTVYFFIEKVPLDYTIHYDGSGQTVSAAGADNNVPKGTGLGIYEGENRWIVMSHMYFWAKRFHQMYPNEMQIYLETDQFICYKIEQNPYRLYDFAINYGYNGPNRPTKDMDLTGEENGAEDSAGGTVGETVPGMTGGTVPGTTTGTIPGTTTGTVPGTTTGTIPGTTAGTVPGATAGTIPGTATEAVPGTTAAAPENGMN